MAKVTKTKLENPEPRKIRPALTPEARENQLIALAVDRVEQRLLDGTATSQEIIHFLRLGSSRNELEMEKLRKENELLRAKTEAVESEKETAALFQKAIEAMKSYRGGSDDEDDYEE